MAAGLFCSQKQIIHEKLADYFSVCPPACLLPFPPFQIAKFLSSLNCHCVEVILVLFFSPLSYVPFNLESSSGTICTSQLLSVRIKHTALYL